MDKCYPWQIKQWHDLLTRRGEQKLPHALLFAGPKGLGKLDFARAIAARLLCQTTCIAEEPACANCQSCQWLVSKTHPDFFLVQPEEESHVIKIEQVRELLESLQQTAQQSGQQIVILEPVEAMNKAAANALLKTLEEPSGPVVFLLVSHQPGTVPATIRSRCQKMDFPVPPISTSLAWLKSQLPLEQDLELVLALSENIPLRAVTFAQESHAAHNLLISHFIQLSENSLTPLEMASICVETPVELVFGGICLLLMDLIRIQQFSSHLITHAPQINTLTAIADKISSRQVFYFLDQLMMAKKHLNAKIHLNMALLWEDLFIEWVKFFRFAA